MVFVTMASGVHRNQQGRGWISKSIALTTAAAAAGALSGAALGALGDHVALDVRAGIGSALALAALGIGGTELTTRRLNPLQIDRETPQRWMDKGALTGASMNGAALGFGGSTRIGFWLWYVVPVGSFLIADPHVGALLYGLYGLIRGSGVWLMMLGWAVWARPRGLDLDDVGVRALHLGRMWRTVAAAQLVAVGTAATLAVGLG